MCGNECIVDVGTQGVQGGTALLEHLAAAHLGTVQTALDLDLDALCTHAHRAGDSHLDGTAIGDLALDLMSDVSGHELCVEFGALNLVNVDLNVLVGEFDEFLLEGLNVGTLLTDDDTGACGADGDGHQLERALDNDACDTSLGKTLVEILADLVILYQCISIITATKPVGVPTADDA